MRAVVQRVEEASVTVGEVVQGAIGRGLLVLLGVESEDTRDDLLFMARKLVSLRVFDDGSGRMNRSVREVGGDLLLVSQFTLFGDCRKGTRPSFSRAADPETAERMYEELAAAIRQEGLKVETGLFQARMRVSSVNEGPVTLIIDSRKKLY